MPTLPLFDPTKRLLGVSHRVRSPGGYEIWRLAAYDPRADAWIETRFYQGYPSPRYMHRNRRFRNHPTRFAPPVPAEYVAVVLVIRARGHSKTVASQFKPEQCVVSDGAAVAIGPHGFAFDGERSIDMTAEGIALKYVSRAASHVPSVAFQLPAVQGETHRWLLADALCDVTGTAEIDGVSRAFSGLGFFDQQYGSAPALHLKDYSFRNNAALIFPPSIDAGESTEIRAYGPSEGRDIVFQEKR